MADPRDGAFSCYFVEPTNELRPGQANAEYGEGLKRPCKVGSYQLNRLGLYDMHGNVWEWCHPEAPDGASSAEYRGGVWDCVSQFCPAAFRTAYPKSFRYWSLGMRLARVPASTSPD